MSLYQRYGDLQPLTDMDVSYSAVGSSVEPDVFGPAMWFTFHNGAVFYPNKPTDYVRHGMKQFLSTVPLIVPCRGCREHFYEFLRSTNLDEAVASRENLFAFWVDVHNYVNRRYGKQTMSLKEAKRLYGFDNPGRGASIRISYGGSSIM